MNLKPSGVEQDSAKKLAMRTELSTKTYPPMLEDLDNFIGDGAFTCGDEVTIADLFLYQANTSYSSGAYDGISPDLFKPFNNIQRIIANVKNIKAVADWEASH